MNTLPSSSTPKTQAKASARKSMTATLQFSDQLIADVLCSALDAEISDMLAATPRTPPKWSATRCCRWRRRGCTL